MGGLTVLLLAALAAVWWWRSLKRRELAHVLARRACERAQVQLLDATVALRRLRLVRHRGRLRPAFDYGFEFSGDGQQRRNGQLTLINHRLHHLHMDLSDGPLSIVEGGD